MNVPGADLVTGELAIEVKSIKTDNSFSAIYDIVKHSSPQAVELYEFSLHRLHHVTTVVFLENFVKGDMCMDSPYLFVLPISAKLRGFLAQARSQADGKKPVCIVRLDSHPIGQSLTFI